MTVGKGPLTKAKDATGKFSQGRGRDKNKQEKNSFFIFIVFFIKRKPTKKKKGTHTATVEPGWPEQGQQPAAAVTGPALQK